MSVGDSLVCSVGILVEYLARTRMVDFVGDTVRGSIQYSAVGDSVGGSIGVFGSYK